MPNKLFLFSAAFFLNIVLGVLLTVVPLLAIKFGASSMMLGIIGFLASLSYIIFAVISGKISDKIGNKQLLLFVLGAISFLFLFCHSINSVNRIIIFMIILNIFSGMFWPALEVRIAKNSGNDLVRALGFFSVVWCSGLTIGIAVSGVLYEINQYLPFYLSAIAAILAFVSILNVKKDPIENIEKNTNEEKFPVDNSKFLIVSWIGIFFGWTAIGAVRYLFPKLALFLCITPSVIGFILLFPSIIQAIASYILIRVKGWQNRLSFILLIEFLMGVSFLIIFYTSNISLFILAFIIIGIGLGVIYFSSIYYSLTAGHTDNGAKTNIHEAIIGGGSLAGPLFAGALANSFTLRTPYLGLFLLGILTIIVQYIYFKKKSSKRP